MSAIIEVENLSFGYTPQSTVLRDISFVVMPGTFLAIAGPNGAGKSTLLNLLCGMLSRRSGTIRIDAAPVESYSTEALAKKVAVVWQEFIPVFGFSVIDTVMMARTPYYGPMGFRERSRQGNSRRSARGDRYGRLCFAASRQSQCRRAAAGLYRKSAGAEYSDFASG